MCSMMHVSLCRCEFVCLAFCISCGELCRCHDVISFMLLSPSASVLIDIWCWLATICGTKRLFLHHCSFEKRCFRVWRSPALIRGTSSMEWTMLRLLIGFHMGVAGNLVKSIVIENAAAKTKFDGSWLLLFRRML